jgi:putative sigma-54 modulation protein
MNVEITGRHVVITPALRTYIMKRLRKFNRLLGDEASIHVIIDVEKARHTAEILLKSKLVDLTCKGQTGDMYASILRAIEKLERQALKRKTRIIETKRQRARAKAAAEKSGMSAIRRPLREGRSDGIALEELDRKPMTVEEATLELRNSDYPFVVFRDLESSAVNVLYRRRDGSLALIHA